MGIGFANSFETFLLARLAIGAIGASFVITQYHTTMMFAPNVVGTANATSAGWVIWEAVPRKFSCRLSLQAC